MLASILSRHFLKSAQKARPHQSIELKIEKNIINGYGDDTEFFSGFNGLSRVRIDSGRVYQNYPVMTEMIRLTGRISFNPCHPVIMDLDSTVCNGYGTPRHRITIPAPSKLLYAILSENCNNEFYESPEMLSKDIVEAYTRMLTELYGKGCKTVDLNDDFMAKFFDNEQTDRFITGGIDIDRLVDLLSKTNNEVIERLPADLYTTLNLLCSEDEAPRCLADKQIASRILSLIGTNAVSLDLNLIRASGYSTLRQLPDSKKLYLVIRMPFDKEYVAEQVSIASNYHPYKMIGIARHKQIAHNSTCIIRDFL